MVASMTAFGRAQGDLLDWEIRSVNHRYLELSFRLPEPFRDLEPGLRELAASPACRGRPRDPNACVWTPATCRIPP